MTWEFVQELESTMPKKATTAQQRARAPVRAGGTYTTALRAAAEAAAGTPADDPFGGHEFEYEGNTDLESAPGPSSCASSTSTPRSAGRSARPTPSSRSTPASAGRSRPEATFPSPLYSPLGATFKVPEAIPHIERNVSSVYFS